MNMKNFAYNCLKLAEKESKSSKSDREVTTSTTIPNYWKSEFVKNTKGHYLTANEGDNARSSGASPLETYNTLSNGNDTLVFNMMDSEPDCPLFKNDGHFERKRNLKIPTDYVQKGAVKDGKWSLRASELLKDVVNTYHLFYTHVSNPFLVSSSLILPV